MNTKRSPTNNYDSYSNPRTQKKQICEIRKLFNKLQDEYGYNELDAILVLKDILAHEYLYNKNRLESIIWKNVFLKFKI